MINELGIYTGENVAEILGLQPCSIRQYATRYGVGLKLAGAWFYNEHDISVIKYHMDRGRGKLKKNK